jgi:pimeloyl-ACP methyl ester carboxylesterase
VAHAKHLAMSGYTERFLRVPDGLSLFARDYAPAGGEAKGLPVICLHGLTRNSADFDVLAERIAAMGRRVIVPDVRGRGRSDNDPQAERYRPNIYVGDTVAWLDALGVPRAIFVGTSMGGIITMLAAVMAGNRIAAAVLNDIGPEVDTRGIARIASYVGKEGPFESWDVAIAAVREMQLSNFPNGDDAFWKGFARCVMREKNGRVEFAYDPAISQGFSSGPVPSMVPLFEALARVPVLVVRGALSDLLAPAGVDVMKRIKSDLDYAEVPGVGHAPTLNEPVAWGAIEKFLMKLP